MPGANPVLNDFLQVRVHCTAGSQLSLNVFHYRVTNVVGGGLSLQQIATNLVGQWNALYRAWMPVSAIFSFVSTQNITPPMTVAFRQTSSSAGTAIGNLTPRQVSGLIQLETPLAGRNQRGRNFIGLVSSTFIDAIGELTGAGFAALTNIAGAVGPTVICGLGGLITTLQLQIRHPNTLGPIIVPQMSDVTSCSASALTATQRRRGDYGRQNV